MITPTMISWAMASTASWLKASKRTGDGTSGATTAASYAWSGLVGWRLAGIFIAGGIVGGLAGVHAARYLAGRRGLLNVVFAAIIICVGISMLARSTGLI